MATVRFDTLKMAKKLEQSGFTWDQAAGLTTALAEVLGGAPREPWRDAPSERKTAGAGIMSDVKFWIVINTIVIIDALLALLPYGR